MQSAAIADAVHSHRVESSWNLMAHGDAQEGKWRRNWWMEWVASTLTLLRNMVYPALLPLMHTPRLPVVDWTDAPANLHGLVRFAERRAARVSSHFNRSLQFHLVASDRTQFSYARKGRLGKLGAIWYKVVFGADRVWKIRKRLENKVEDVHVIAQVLFAEGKSFLMNWSA